MPKWSHDFLSWLGASEESGDSQKAWCLGWVSSDQRGGGRRGGGGTRWPKEAAAATAAAAEAAPWPAISAIWNSLWLSIFHLSSARRRPLSCRRAASSFHSSLHSFSGPFIAGRSSTSCLTLLPVRLRLPWLALYFARFSSSSACSLLLKSTVEFRTVKASGEGARTILGAGTGG